MSPQIRRFSSDQNDRIEAKLDLVLECWEGNESTGTLGMKVRIDRLEMGQKIAIWAIGIFALIVATGVGVWAEGLFKK